jgi:hypothetical protein
MILIEDGGKNREGTERGIVEEGASAERVCDFTES